MGTLDNIFSKVSNKRTRDAQQAALQMVANKKTNHISKSNVVPKSMKQKVEYAKDLSEEVFGDKLQRMELVVDKDRILEYSDKVLENGIVALDTETNGLDRIDGKIAGICLYTPSEKGIYVPVGHISYMTNQPIKQNVDKELMRQIIQEWEDKGVKFILHNSKFDMHILWWMIGVKITPYWDTLIASNLLNENEPHGLKVLWQKYCVGEDEDTKVASFNSLFNGIEFNKIPPEVGYMYASFDPIMTYELYKFQEEYLDKDGKYCYSKGLERVADVFRDIEMPLIPVVFEMECTGVKIDTDLAKELHDKYTFYMDRAERKFKEEIDKISDKFDDLLVKSPDKYNKLFGDGKTISISSPTQLAILFYDVMGFVSKDDKKPRGTGEDIISQFNHPIVEAILEYRAMSKLLSTYIDAIPTHISKRDNKLHATFNQYGAKTGRFSSSNPNLQNIPSQKTKLSDGTVIDAGHDIRQMFMADEGQVIIGGDFSQQEPRCLAHMSGDEKLIQAQNSSEDIHRATASEVFGVPLSDVTPEQRRNAKAVNFGIIYGMSSFGLSQDLSISRKEAKEYIDKYFATYPTIKTFIDGLVKDAKEKGYSLTMYGRRREIPEIKSQNFMQRSFGERVAMNAPIQGTAADIIKIAMINVYNELKNRNLKSRLILQVHDELLVEAAAEEVDVVKQIMLDGMKNAASLKVMLEVDMKSGNDWLEAH